MGIMGNHKNKKTKQIVPRATLVASLVEKGYSTEALADLKRNKLQKLLDNENGRHSKGVTKSSQTARRRSQPIS